MIVAGGSFALLTGIEGTVMRELVNSFPNVVSKDALHRALYELDPEGGAEPKIVDVIVCKIRKKVKPLGIEIDTSWGRGYALSVRVHSSSEAA
jgi:DNA-binding response OmpR family regulator